jgi:pimeloyl-ACP methyl ester carboxylesterase
MDVAREMMSCIALSHVTTERDGYESLLSIARPPYIPTMQPQDPADWRSLYPFRSHYQTIEGVRLHFLDEGSGEPLLMVHGNPTWSFYWRNLVQAWRGRYRVVVPDHIGCGLSDKPQDYPYTLKQHIQNLTALIEHLDLRGVTLLAHDWGGAIGLGAILRMPHRFARIVLFNTGAFPPPFIPKRIAICRTPLLGTIAVRGLNLFARAALSMAVEKPDRMTPAVKAGLLAPYDTWEHRVAVHRFVQDIPFTRRHPTWQTLADIEAGLASLSARPIQLIWGMRDWCFTPACLERFVQHFPRAEVHRLQDAGHYVVEDAHERIIPLVDDFLTATPAGLSGG